MAKPFIERVRDRFSSEAARQEKFALKLDLIDKARADLGHVRDLADKRIRAAESALEAAEADARAHVPGVDHLVEQVSDALTTAADALDRLGHCPDRPTPTGASPDELEAYQAALAAWPEAMAEHQRQRLAIADKAIVVLDAVAVERKKIAALRSRLGLKTPGLYRSDASATWIGSQGFIDGSAKDAPSMLRSVAVGDRASSPLERSISNTVTERLLRNLLGCVGLTFDDAAEIAKAQERAERALHSERIHGAQIQRAETAKSQADAEREARLREMFGHPGASK